MYTYEDVVGTFFFVHHIQIRLLHFCNRKGFYRLDFKDCMERKGLLDEGSTLSEVANKLKKKKVKESIPGVREHIVHFPKFPTDPSFSIPVMVVGWWHRATCSFADVSSNPSTTEHIRCGSNYTMRLLSWVQCDTFALKNLLSVKLHWHSVS